MNTIPFLKENQIHRFYDLEEIVDSKLFNLYTGKNVVYRLKTDGFCEEGDIWLDKRPYQRDDDLEKCGQLKRHEILVSDADFILVEKKIKNTYIQDFYLNNYYLENLVKNKKQVFVQLDFNEKEKIRVRTLEGIWK